MDISCPSHLVYFNHNNKHLKGEKNYGEVLSGKYGREKLKKKTM